MREHHPQHHAHLGVGGQIVFGGAVDQRVEIDQPAQHFAGDGAGERPVLEAANVAGRGAEGDIERLAAPQHGIEQAQRGAARGETGGHGHGGSPTRP